jgi:Ni,Fe-hydrogenase III component G
MSKITEALGFQPAKISALPGNTNHALVSFDQFISIVGNWNAMSETERPALMGIMPSPGESSRLHLNFILAITGEKNLFCLEVDVARDRTLPDLRAIWPSAGWWHEELAVFSGARFEGLLRAGVDADFSLLGGTKWQQA